MALNAKSEVLLSKVHPDLHRVIRQAARSADFIVTEGLRTVAR